MLCESNVMLFPVIALLAAGRVVRSDLAPGAAWLPPPAAVPLQVTTASANRHGPGGPRAAFSVPP